MARPSVSKVRAAEKSKPPSSQTPAAVTQEIVTGKFNETDWKYMLEKDGNEEFVAEIVDELIQLTMHAAYMKYIERQLLPFTITQARDAILEIIQCQFLARDEGEPTITSNAGWAGDAEPEPAETDCWAQGSMPKKIIEPKPLKKISEVPEDEASVEVSVVQMQEVPTESTELPDAVSDTEVKPTKYIKYTLVDVTEPDSEHADKVQEEKVPRRKVSLSKKSKTPAEPEVIKLNDESSKQAVDKVEVPQKKPTSCSSYIKSLLVHPIGAKDAVFDEYGHVIAVSKLDPEKLPTHKVSVKFTITDPTKDSELELKKKNQASTRYKPKVGPTPTEASNKAAQSRISQMAFDKNAAKQVTTPKVSSLAGDEDQTTQRRSLIEEIEVSQGIIIRENGKVKKGPGRYYRKLDILEEGMKGMKPVNLRLSKPGITVADLLDRKSPILHNLRGDTPPLPPIVPHPQHQAKQMS